MIDTYALLKVEQERFKLRFSAAQAHLTAELLKGLKADFYDEDKEQFKMQQLMVFVKTLIEETHDDVALAKALRALSL